MKRKMDKVVNCLHFFLLPLLLLLLLAFTCSSHNSHAAASKSTVEYLPGLQGRLPFHLETGYIGVGEAELFYYFVKSEGNPEADPLLLWLSGGPGCSGFSALALEIGPIEFEVLVAGYNGSLPTLILNPFSWTEFSSIIFLDLLAGTGFSYTTNPSPAADHPSDQVQVSQAAEFIRKWLGGHSEFLQNPLYIAGDSYAGMIIPAVVQRLSIANEKGIEPLLNLKGYIIGNPVTGHEFDDNARIPYAHGMALISDELYETLHKSCKGEYHTVEPTNLECKNNLKAFYECISGINIFNILDPECNLDLGKASMKIVALKKRMLRDESQLLLTINPPKVDCKYDFNLLCKHWANDELVHKALHVREGTTGEWERCNIRSNYEYDIPSSFVYHVNLSTKGYRSLIYSGDHDMLVSYIGTQAWIRALNYSIVEDWRSWHVEGQVAGYTRIYSNGMTYATVKGGSHVPPTNRPVECYAMFQRWINHKSL